MAKSYGTGISSLDHDSILESTQRRRALDDRYDAVTLLCFTPVSIGAAVADAA
jgi:hypothetical protein